MLTPKTTAVLALALAVSACDEGLTELNENPNAPTAVSAQFILPQAQKAVVDRALGSNFGMTLTDLWVQHLSKVQYIDEDRYELRPQTIEAHFRGFYQGPLIDFEEIVRQGEEAKNPNWVAVATIMQAYTFGVMTDVWGDIPFSEALKGREDVNTPKYDTQKDIYYGLLADLKASSDMIQPSGAAFGSADIIYGSDMAAWKRFANSLRMRLAMRLSEGDAAKGRAEFAAAFQAGGFTSNAHNAQLNYKGGKPDQNPRFVFFETRYDHTISRTIVDTLKSFNDPRLAVYATPVPGTTSTYRGMPNGLSNDHGINFGTALSSIGDYFLAATAPAVMMSYAEVLFLQAEAAQRGWISASASGLYNQAITASMQQYGVSAAAISTYLAQPRVQYSAATGLRQIALQKWIALFGNGPEAFAEYRRTGLPQLTPGPANTNGGKVPSRVPYPGFEQSFNKENLEFAVARNGGMTLNDPVWWDK
ncbi:MAG: SusD/RagB family nutrient-binding outer membrane lipoprotein [Actinomycetota bacterium]|nr:SusD/RagB family nutrient-binding outer membrane lipoprotein [Actinomycetota bacterium]